MVLARCRSVKVVSMSRYASKRLNPDVSELFSERNIRLKICIEVGRPSLVEKRLYSVIL
jgi:hypothetical protein